LIPTAPAPAALQDCIAAPPPSAAPTIQL
jgi:hypothetical protein